jgi:hypothetical protein
MQGHAFTSGDKVHGNKNANTNYGFKAARPFEEDKSKNPWPSLSMNATFESLEKCTWTSSVRGQCLTRLKTAALQMGSRRQ